jgi:hypothetical protein
MVKLAMKKLNLTTFCQDTGKKRKEEKLSERVEEFI